MLSTFGLSSPRKNWLLRSVRTTSLSTVNCTLRQNALCSSGVMESLARSRGSAGAQRAAPACRLQAGPAPPHPCSPWGLPTNGGVCAVIQCWGAARGQPGWERPLGAPPQPAALSAGGRCSVKSGDKGLSTLDTELGSNEAKSGGRVTALVRAHPSVPGTHCPKKVWVTVYTVKAGLHLFDGHPRPPSGWGGAPLPLLLDLGVFLALLRPQSLPLLRRGLVAVISQQEGPDLPPD